MKQSNIEKFEPTDLHKFLMQSARANFDDNSDDFNAGMAMMMGLVKKYFCNEFYIPIRDNNGWISVDDELPTQASILARYNDGVICEWHSYVKDDGYTDLTNRGNYKITHWQPLPQPPKEN